MAALLKLARWCQERRFVEQGGESCPVSTLFPPSQVPLGPFPPQTPVVPLEQLWTHLPVRHRQLIGVTLAQMIARQIRELPASPLNKEESDE